MATRTRTASSSGNGLPGGSARWSGAASSDSLASMTPLQQRRLVAACVGLLAAGLTFAGHYPTGIRTDFDALWVAGHAWTHGQDPFAAARAYASRPPGYDLLYPATAFLLTAPFTVWPRAVCLALWSGLGFGALTYSVTRPQARVTQARVTQARVTLSEAKGPDPNARATLSEAKGPDPNARVTLSAANGPGPNASPTWWGLLSLSSPFALHAFFSVQWSPVLVASATLPWLAFLWIAKPSIGAALFAAYPSRRMLVAGLLVTLVTFVVFPGWVAEWRAALGTRHHLIPLVLRPGGWLLLLAWLRWRQPEGRLLGTLAIVPHTVMPYDLLTLAILLRTRLEWIGATVLAWASYLAVRTWAWIPPSRDHDASIVLAWPYWLVLCYLPALALVLLRPDPAPEATPDASPESVGPAPA